MGGAGAAAVPFETVLFTADASIGAVEYPGADMFIVLSTVIQVIDMLCSSRVDISSCCAVAKMEGRSDVGCCCMTSDLSITDKDG